jgi:AraC-like DNA-binding protein
MSCHSLYRSDALEISRCVGDASHRDPVEMRFSTYELHFQDDGAYFLHAGRETVLVDVHHVELRRAGTVQTYSRPVVSADRGTSVRFSQAVLGGIWASATDSSTNFTPNVVPLDWPGFLQLRGLRRALDEGIGIDSPEMQRRVLALVGRLLTTARVRARGEALFPRPSSRRRQAVERAKAFLVEHSDARPSLADVAARAEYAPHHFARIFREVTGQSVHRYLTGLRLRQAAVRLDDGAHNFASLALELGFSSQSHFTTAFRAHFGCAPGTYVRRPLAIPLDGRPGGIR